MAWRVKGTSYEDGRLLTKKNKRKESVSLQIVVISAKGEKLKKKTK